MTNCSCMGAQWLSGRALDSRPRSHGFEPHRRHCVVSLSKNINPSLVLVQPRKTHPCITERLLMGRKESNQTNKQKLFMFRLSLRTCFFFDPVWFKFSYFFFTWLLFSYNFWDGIEKKVPEHQTK